MRAAVTLIKPLVLTAPRGRLRAGARWALVCGLVCAGVAAGYVRGAQVVQAQLPATAGDPTAPLHEQLDAARLALRLAQAHGSELERQIDTLQQRLQAAQEEMSFLRQARDARRR